MAHYGGPRCRCCGERNLWFLTIDHIRRDGAKHRAKIKNTPICLWLKRHGYPRGFRVLCMNCNWGQRYLSKCPHKWAV